MTRPIDASSWISEVLYKRVDGHCARCLGTGTVPAGEPYKFMACDLCLGSGVEETRYLAIFTQKGDRALLYEGIPSQICGLVQAGLGGRSVGKAYNKLVKGKFPYQKIVGKEKVDELRKIMILG